MRSNELPLVEESQSRSRSELRSGSGLNLRILIMLGVAAFPVLALYSLADGRRASAHTLSSSVVAKVRISRASVDTRLLVRSPLPPPVAPKPVSTPVR